MRTVEPEDDRVGSVTQANSTGSNGLQHWLQIRRRPRNNAQDSTRGRLLLQSLFEFIEQPHVLDCDHGLVGKGFKQLDLRRGEGMNLGSTCVQRSNEFSLL